MAQITIVGNLTNDPRLFTKGKTPRAIFTVAENERPREEGGEERSHFLQCTAWGTLAENLASSLSKGTRVVATGRVNTYNKDVEIDGDEVALTMTSFTVSAIGADLRWAEAEVSKVKPRARLDEDDDEEDEEPKPRATNDDEEEGEEPKSKSKSKAKDAEDDEDDDVF